MITTGDAADRIGVRYETLRNWLKKGFLETDPEAGRTWRQYSDGDIARLQLVKDGLDAGVPLDVLIDVCNDAELVNMIGDEELSPGGLALLIWPTLDEAQFMLVRETAVAQELRRNRAPATVLSLTHARRALAA
ncbi:MAG: helix-turn-helix domain-containing protein [Pseudomonadota bacterium]